ncbi:hypothetical protein [Streptomyces sp. NPDC059466]|uniref:hypothetical protein n=1 Tax=unclassified Streptomyces TaxID=2593676 RepID=UPI00368EE567
MKSWLALRDATEAQAKACGGKVFNTWRLIRLLARSSCNVSVPESAIIPNLAESARQPEAALIPAAYPLIFRSSSVLEDAGDSSFSGLLTSTPVFGEESVPTTLSTMAEEAAALEAYPASALVQPLISVHTGFVVGIVGNGSSPKTARVEHAVGEVPVESSPDGWLMFKMGIEDGSPVWELDDESTSLTGPVDLVGIAQELLLLASLDWDEKLAETWYMELEAGTDGIGRLWCFQVRFDLRTTPTWADRPLRVKEFGTDRNFPPPVSNLTASLLGPVLSNQFKAPIVLDERSRTLVCRSTSVPPAAFREQCIKAVRNFGTLDVTSLVDHLDSLNSLWRRVRESWVSSLDDESVSGALDRLRMTEAYVEGYFSTSWFRCGVGTEIICAPQLEAIELAALDTGYRSRLALELRDATYDELLRLTGDLPHLSVLLFGSDAVGEDRLVHSLSLTPAEQARLLGRFFDRDMLIDADTLVSILRPYRSDSKLLESMTVALWAQDFDNQIKDAAYLVAYNAIDRIASHLAIDRSLLHFLSVDEIAAACTDSARASQANLLAGLRSATVEVLDSGALNEAAIEAPIQLSRISQPIACDEVLEFVLADSFEDICDDSDSLRGRRVYVISALSPTEALHLPPVRGIWLFELGEMSHASHLLRVREDIGFIVLGRRQPMEKMLGTYSCKVVDSALVRTSASGPADA